MEPFGLYIHVPFCLSKCPYCDFYSIPATDWPGSDFSTLCIGDTALDRYTARLCGILDDLVTGGIALPGETFISGRSLRERGVDTLYLGGGTPSLLGPERLGRILQAAKGLGLLPGAEITLEANPATIDEDALMSLRESGFTRLSLGVQSGLDRELANLGRRYNAGQAEQAVRKARHAGFANISVDLMLGTPGQTKDSLRASLDFLAGLGAEHVSAYLLKIEEGTPFARENTIRLCPGDDETAELYLLMVERLEALGYHQYEVSNFARPGMESRHNLKYWKGREYLGLGPSAHSFLGGRRFFFPRDLEGFLSQEPVWSALRDDGPGGGLEEEIMLRLRLTEGIELPELEKRYGVSLRSLEQAAAPLIGAGLVEMAGRRIRLTPKGFLLSNPVTVRLLDAILL